MWLLLCGVYFIFFRRVVACSSAFVKRKRADPDFLFESDADPGDGERTGEREKRKDYTKRSALVLEPVAEKSASAA